MPAGTWNLPKIRKTVPYRGIKDISTIEIFDTTPTSDNYFNVLQIPDRLTSGKNLIKLNAANNTLVDNSEIHIEILDYNGDPIYFEPLTYLEQDGTRVIAIYIYPTTSPGLATLYIAGRALVDVFDNNRPLPYSETLNTRYAERTSLSSAVTRNDAAARNFQNYKDFPNILWSRTINVAPEKRNSSQIIFTANPTVTVVERVVNYQQPITLNNVNVATSASNASIIVESVPVQGGAVANASNLNATYAQVGLPAMLEGATTPHTPAATGGAPFSTANLFTGTAAASVNLNSNTSIVNAAVATLAEPADVPAQSTSQGIVLNTGYSRMTTTNFPLSSSMEGGLLVVKNPVLSVDMGTALAGSPAQVQPASDIPGHNFHQFVPSAMSAAADIPASGSIVFIITDVESTTQAKISQLAGPGHSAPVLTAFNYVALKSGNNTQNINQSLGSPEAYDIKSIQATANFTSSHTEPIIYSTTAQSQSFAEVVLGNIEPATGDVYKIKTSYKPAGQFGDFIDAGDTILERIELLEDSGSFEGAMSIGQIYNRMGYFTDLSDYNTYFEKDVTGNFMDVTETFEPDVFMNSIKLPQSANFNTTNSRAIVIRSKASQTPSVKKNTRYTTNFRLKCVGASDNDGPLTYTLGTQTSTITKPRFDVYVHGSEGTGTITPIQESYDAYRITDYALEPTLKDELVDDGELGRLIGTIEMEPSIASVNSLRDVSLSFESLADQSIRVSLVQRNGIFAFKDLGISTDAETGFSPNHTRMNIRIPSAFINVPMIFKFEYFDYLGQRADTETTVFPVKFIGDNTVISGTNNLLSGSLFIGNTIGNGIEMAGVNSGFIRTIGYEGFNSASRTDKPGGFIMYTGSVLPGAPDEYSGVGLELVADSGSFLRFATDDDVSGKPAGLEVRTPRFFLGSDSQFISGANGNIEISSSNFHLQNDGDVIMQGTITAEAGGTIGGFSINSSSISAGTAFQLSSSINENDPVSFISSSAFKVSAGGRITASAGLIGGFKILTSTLSSTIGNLHINSSVNRIKVQKDNGAGQNTDFVEMKYTSATDWGMLGKSASNTVFSLGHENEIAGWAFDTERFVGGALELNKSGYIKSTDSWMISSSAFEGDPAGFISSSAFKVSPGGKITGSDVLFSGGKIAAWNIEGDVLYAGDVNGYGGFVLGGNATLPFFRFGHDADNNIAGHYFSAGNFGLKGLQAGNTIFSLGDGTTVKNQIAGWEFNDTELQGGNMIIRKDGTIESANFASNVPGSGFRLTAAQGGFLEVENARIRGTLATAVFEKETVNAVGGQLYVANSTALTASIIAPEGIHSASMATMSVVNVSGFAQGEIITAKKVSSTGFATEYMFVDSASRQDASSETNLSGFLFVQRGYSGSTQINSFTTGSVGDLASSAQSYSGSQVIVSTGKEGTGYIRLNANPNDPTTPFIDIVERTGGSIYDIDLKARLGDLSGLSSARLHGTDPAGQFGLYTKNAFLEGGIIANTGSIGGINMRDNKLFTGAGIHDDVDTGFFASSSGLFSLGDKLVWDGTNLAIQGSITITGGTDVITPADTGSMLATATGSLVSNSVTGSMLATATGSLLNVNATGSMLASVTASINNSTSSLHNPSNYSFGGAGFDLTTHTAAAGLNLTSKFVGYHDGTEFQTFMSSSGDFYLGGEAGVFQWDASANSLHMSGSLVELNVPTFFFGEEGADPSVFISGSQGNLEISSSNFHLTRDGNITASNANLSGKVTATSGQIGGFTIGADSLTATNFDLDPSGKRISLGSGNNIFIADGDEGIQLGHATFGSAPFSVTKAGALKAESGTIGGFTIDDHSITTTGVEINDSSQGLFISSSEFKVFHNGELSASNANFDGYAIARALRQKVITITSANDHLYFDTVSINHGAATDSFARLKMDGSLGGEVTAHVILDLDCTSANNGNQNGDQPALARIVGPSVPGFGKSRVTIEIADGRTVTMLDPAEESSAQTGGFSQVASAAQYNSDGGGLLFAGNAAWAS